MISAWKALLRLTNTSDHQFARLLKRVKVMEPVKILESCQPLYDLRCVKKEAGLDLLALCKEQFGCALLDPIKMEIQEVVHPTAASGMLYFFDQYKGLGIVGANNGVFFTDMITKEVKAEIFIDVHDGLFGFSGYWQSMARSMKRAGPHMLVAVTESSSKNLLYFDLEKLLLTRADDPQSFKPVQVAQDVGCFTIEGGRSPTFWYVDSQKLLVCKSGSRTQEFNGLDKDSVASSIAASKLNVFVGSSSKDQTNTYKVFDKRLGKVLATASTSTQHEVNEIGVAPLGGLTLLVSISLFALSEVFVYGGARLVSVHQAAHDEDRQQLDLALVVKHRKKVEVMIGGSHEWIEKVLVELK